MENFEQEELRQEPVEQEMPKQEQAEPSIQQPYHGAGAGRKESPFANSPYVMNHEQPKAESAQYQYTYIPPIPPQEPPRKMKKPKSGNSRKVWKAVLCAVLAILCDSLWKACLALALSGIAVLYLSFLITTVVALLSDRENIKLPLHRKIALTFVHPLFYMQYIFIIGKALLRPHGKRTWEAIERVDFSENN